MPTFSRHTWRNAFQSLQQARQPAAPTGDWLACRLLCVITCLLSCSPLRAVDRPRVIAHRGASGYLPEHTLPATAMAYAQRADLIEQDVVLSKDGVPLVLHDIHIDTVTNVAQRFPQRARADGRYYAIDFTLGELRSLRVVERFDPQTKRPIFPDRFPAGAARFSIATLAEAIQLIQGLNKTTGREVGIYPEIKSPAWHRQQGHDISKLVLETLARHGYTSAGDRVFLQCFEQAELIRIRGELTSELRLIQLIAAQDDELTTPRGLRHIATYAQGIGPHLSSIFDAKGNISSLVQDAHTEGLEVHPYTFRRDALPPGFRRPEALLDACRVAAIDALFTDFPDICVDYFSRNVQAK